jgi:hypothetical protein
MSQQDEFYFAEPIEDVSRSTYDLVKRKYLTRTVIWLGLGVVWAVFSTWLFFSILQIQNSGDDIDGAFYIIIGPFITFFIWLSRIKSKVQTAFMDQFALRNGYAFSPKGSLEGEQGLIFCFGHSKEIKNVVSGLVKEFPIRLFNYKATVGQGRSRVDHNLTVFEVAAKYNLPQMFLNSKKAPFMSGHSNPFSIDKDKILKLEGDFNQYFDLYVPTQYEQEALEVFTPVVMAAFIDTAQNYDLEITGNKVRVIASGTISDLATLNAMYTKAHNVIEVLEKALTRINFVPIGDFAPSLVAKSSWFGRQPAVIVLAIMVLAGFIWGIVLVFMSG